VTLEKFQESYNADLANGLGNLAARIMKLAETNLDGPVESKETKEFPKEYISSMENFQYNEVADQIWLRIAALDQFITEKKPFLVVKEKPEEGKEQITSLVLELTRVAELLQPFMPKTSEKILSAVKTNKKPENLFARKE
jgi:methionyl-tRNA synthetase